MPNKPPPAAVVLVVIMAFIMNMCGGIAATIPSGKFFCLTPRHALAEFANYPAHMDQPATPPTVFQFWGFWALTVGLFGIVAVFIQIAGPNFEPAPSVGSQIGEIAGEMKRSAWRSFFGMAPPEPEVVPFTWKDWLPLVGPVLGAIAIVLAVLSAIRGEDRRFFGYGVGPGGNGNLVPVHLDDGPVDCWRDAAHRDPEQYRRYLQLLM